MNLDLHTSPELRPTQLTIDLEALAHNVRAIKRHVGGKQVMAVVKANAYGHGLIECSRTLLQHGADALGVALVEEGVALRRAGITAPILVFGGILSDQIAIYLENDLDLTASSVSKLHQIAEVAQRLGKRARVHLKIDTGMGRIGVRPESAPALFAEAAQSTHCDIVGIFTHYATSDEDDLSHTLEQTAMFRSVISQYPTIAGKPAPLIHAANSAATIRLTETHFDMVRPGLALFGVLPSSAVPNSLGLRPVLKVSSKVVFFKVVRAGESVSYGRTWTASKDTRVVTIPIGYGDGYPRALSNVGQVLIRGKRYPIVGRVCMDQIMVAIGDGEAYNGDEVVLVGTQRTESLPLEEVAAAAGTIPYELLTALNLRIPRRYGGGSSTKS